MEENHQLPTRFDFSYTELVGHLDVVGNTMTNLMNGEPLPFETARSVLMVLRCVRDDLAARGNLPTRAIYQDTSYLAECMIRDLHSEGIFDRLYPLSEEEGA